MTTHSRQKVDSAIHLADKFASHIYVLGLLETGQEADRKSMETIIEQVKKCPSGALSIKSDLPEEE